MYTAFVPVLFLLSVLVLLRDLITRPDVTGGLCVHVWLSAMVL